MKLKKPTKGALPLKSLERKRGFKLFAGRAFLAAPNSPINLIDLVCYVLSLEESFLQVAEHCWLRSIDAALGEILELFPEVNER